jgi:hypothetical protein
MTAHHGALELRSCDLDIKRVETMPLLGGDLLADVAGVFAGGDDAGDDRGLEGGVEGERPGELVGVAVPFEALGLTESLEQTHPAAVGAGGALVEHEVEVHVEQARSVFGALEVAAHPVERIGDAREHAGRLRVR